MEQRDSLVRVGIILEKHRPEASRAPVRSERYIGSHDRSDLPEQVFQVLPLALERQL